MPVLRTGFAGSFVSEQGAVRGEEGSTPRASRYEDPDRSTFFCHHPIFSSFSSIFRFEGGGVSGERVADTPLPHHTPGTR